MPKAHEQDMLIVKNIALDDHTLSRDIKQVPRTLYDERGERATEYELVEEVWDNSKGFRVKWGGKWHVLKPGEKKLMPRYIAEHWSHHLIDHLMLKANHNLSDKVERARLQRQIIIGVYEFFESEEEEDGVAAVREVEEANSKVSARELDGINLGVLDQDEPVMEMATLEDEAPQDLPPAKPAPRAKSVNLRDPKALPTVEELRVELDGMQIEYAESDSAEQLVAKLKQFA